MHPAPSPWADVLCAAWLVVSRANCKRVSLINAGPENLRVAELQCVLKARSVVRLALQGKLRDAAVRLLLLAQAVADGERVVLPKLKIEARAQVEARLRVGHCGRIVVGVAVCVQQFGIDNGVRLVLPVKEAGKP